MVDRTALRALPLVLLSLLALPDRASAWCPTLTEGPRAADDRSCPPMLDRHALFWNRPCTSMSLSSAQPSTALTTEEVTSVLRTALDQWENADCGSGVTPGVHVTIIPELNACTEASHYSRGPNVHSVIFVDDEDEWARRGHEARAFALTFVWHDTNTGVIVDGDIEINESRGRLQICPDTGCDLATDAVDFGNVITHEVGHYFGIGHTTIDHPEATMFPNAPFGEIQKRDLDPDDIDAICSTYPPGSFETQTCDPTPENGLALDCAAPSCGCAAPGVGSPDASVVALLAGIALVGARRRKRYAEAPRGRQP